MNNENSIYGVLFVCTGNICRSPVAEGILQKMLDEEVRDNTYVASAGIIAGAGIPASEHSVKVCNEFGIDISHHRSQPVHTGLLKEFDLILTMELSHREWIHSYFPQYSGRTHTLKAFLNTSAGNNQDVTDPVGADISFYRTIFKEIFGEIRRIYPDVKKLIRKKTGE